MKVTAEWLETEIKKQNDWLQTNSPSHYDYKRREHKRNYYVNKLIEKEENGLLTINI
ncbi:MAG: hypothetical protein KKC03_01170 [Bacteroidetes bacterium]|nr:hypothetical protein [Bacteroidota bacterium]